MPFPRPPDSPGALRRRYIHSTVSLGRHRRIFPQKSPEYPNLSHRVAAGLHRQNSRCHPHRASARKLPKGAFPTLRVSIKRKDAKAAKDRKVKTKGTHSHNVRSERSHLLGTNRSLKRKRRSNESPFTFPAILLRLRFRLLFPLFPLRISALFASLR